MARDPGREIVPAVQKLRIQHAKRGRLRFTSHRDFQRAFERALRRANIPMAYSAGFSPFINHTSDGIKSVQAALQRRFEPQTNGKNSNY